MIVDLNSVCDAEAIEILKDNNTTVVGRYYTKHSWLLKAPEAADICKAGMKLFTVFENTGHRDLVLTEDQGREDGKHALGYAIDAKQPQSTVIYFAAEGLEDGYNEADLPGVRDYFKGAGEGIAGKYKIGVYGDGAVCKTLLGSYCSHAWIAAASYTHPGTQDFYAGRKWVLAQTRTEHWLQGKTGKKLQVDLNERNGDFGAFTVPFAGS